LVLPVLARAATFTATLDRDTITQGESATLSLVFDGGTPQSEPTPPQVPNLQISYVGPSSQFSVINGKVSSSITYNFQVTPTRPGDYTIPGMVGYVGNEKLTTQPLTLKVLKPSAPPPEALQAGTQDAFIRLMLTKTNAYVGEVFTVQLQLYVATRVQGVDAFRPTGFPADGFNVGKMVQGQAQRTRIGNTAYQVVPFDLTLTALKAGTMNIGPATVNLVIELPSANRQRDPFADPFNFFNRNEQRQLTLASDSATVQCLPLPREKVLANFNGAVGTYTMSVTAGPTNVAEGDPITVKVQLTGRGWLDALRLPDQSGWHDFKMDPPTTKVELADKLGIQGTKTFEQIVTPQKADLKELPPFSFSFFDPEKRMYQTLTQPGIPLVVRATGAAPIPVLAASRQAQDTAAPAQDIAPNKQRLGTVAQIGPPLLERGWFLALQGFPLAAFFAAVAWRKRTEALAQNPRLRRRRQVAQILREGLIDLRRQAAEDRSEEFFATLFRLMQEQLGERLDLPASAITEAVVEERLRPRGAPEPLCASVQELFDICNFARYARTQTTQELHAIVGEFEALLCDLQALNL
jgi:hypothetical protein